MDSTIHFDVIRSELKKEVFNETEEVCDELTEAVDQIWGSELEEEEEKPVGVFEVGDERERGWRTVVLYESLTRIVARMSNRVFVGLPLCECFPSSLLSLLTAVRWDVGMAVKNRQWWVVEVHWPDKRDDLNHHRSGYSISH